MPQMTITVAQLRVFSHAQEPNIGKEHSLPPMVAPAAIHAVLLIGHVMGLWFLLKAG